MIPSNESAEPHHSSESGEAEVKRRVSDLIGFLRTLPNSRGRSLAITKAQEAEFWAVHGIKEE